MYYVMCIEGQIYVGGWDIAIHCIFLYVGLLVASPPLVLFDILAQKRV